VTLVSPYSDAYFLKARDTLRKDGRDPIVTMQVFQRKDAILCGLDEAIDYIQGHTDSSYVKIRTLKKDGDSIKPWESVMHIIGPYRQFAHLETQYLGILARGTMIATNTRHVVEAANGKPIFFMGARHTHWLTQEVDGYAAHIGGATYVGTDAQGEWSGDRGMGTMPHSFIAAYDGSMAQACEAFARHNEGPITALVDFHNDSLFDIGIAEKILGKRLTAVRLDTSGSLVDDCLSTEYAETGLEALKGVNVQLVFKVRNFLDTLGRPDVKIVVSGGFNSEKIKSFEDRNAPVDMYGVGSSILVGSNDYTADIVSVTFQSVSKVGRGYVPLGEVPK
jgi:nicotinate phosphoribosyltransferase